MNALILFCTTFVLVFALGFQSLNVNKGHHLAAFLTSFLIGGSNLVILRAVPQGDLLEVAGYLLGGPFGIIASMWLHKRVLGHKASPKTESGTVRGSIDQRDARRYRAFTESAHAYMTRKKLTPEQEAIRQSIRALATGASVEEFGAAIDAALEGKING